MMSVPYFETIHHCVCLLELLPQNPEFFKLCIKLFGIALPMLCDWKLALNTLKEIAKIVFTEAVSKIAQRNRRKKALKFISAYQLTYSILTEKTSVKEMLRLLLECKKWQDSVLYLDQLTRIVMSLANREKTKESEKTIDLACYGDAKLPGIFKYFQPRSSSRKLELRARGIWPSNYWKVAQKLI